MKVYSSLLAQYLVSRHQGDHAMALDLAMAISNFWSLRDNQDEARKWRKVQAEHHARIV